MMWPSDVENCSLAHFHGSSSEARNVIVNDTDVPCLGNPFRSMENHWRWTMALLFPLSFNAILKRQPEEAMALGGVRTKVGGSSVGFKLKLVHFSRSSKLDHNATFHGLSVELSMRTVNLT